MNQRLFFHRLAAPRRSAFTLIELLVVIVIIGVLSGAAMFAVFGVVEEGNIARTKSQIARINELITERWETYRTRAVPVKNLIAATNPKAAAQQRLYALRELMRLELPDRMNDVMFIQSELDYAGPNSYLTKPKYLVSLPALSLNYRRRATSGWTNQYESAECLYMILQCLPEENGSSLNFFSSSEIGDKDNDGMREILDAWGNPICFLRWAPGFESDRQYGKWSIDPSRVAPDPYDPARADPRWPTSGSVPTDGQLFFSFPLIFSAGPDGLYDIAVGDGSFSYFQTGTSTQSPGPYDPFPIFSSAPQMGTQGDLNADGYQNHFDNLHNHLIEIK